MGPDCEHSCSISGANCSWVLWGRSRYRILILARASREVLLVTLLQPPYYTPAPPPCPPPSLFHPYILKVIGLRNLVFKLKKLQEKCVTLHKACLRQSAKVIQILRMLCSVKKAVCREYTMFIWFYLRFKQWLNIISWKWLHQLYINSAKLIAFAFSTNNFAENSK